MTGASSPRQTDPGRSGLELADIARVTICVCTYRRPALRLTLESIAAQQLPEGVQLSIVVADNDAEPTRRPDIQADFEALGLNARYVHAPLQNISIARNACLDHVETRWAIFIDDDEIARPDWVAQLLSKRAGMSCVFGAAQAIYDPDAAPDWMIAGDYHSNRIGPREAAHNGYTCNTLLDMDFIRAHGLRFKEELGQVGGEDTMFFREMADLGGRFDFAPDAVVTEYVTPKRATLSWLLKRRYRAGQVHFLLLQRQGLSRLGAALPALAKAAYCLGASVVLVFWRRRSIDNLLRGVLHWGVVASACGAGLYKEYG